MATCTYQHERWAILDTATDKVLIWRPGRKERWVNEQAVNQAKDETTPITETTSNG